MPNQLKENPDINTVRALQVDLANDPEKFSDWEHNFCESLFQQLERNGDGFGLTIKQREVCEKIQDKADKEV